MNARPHIRSILLLYFGVVCSIAAAREWVSADGRFKIEAEFVELQADNKVILRRPEGNLIRIDLDKLSQDDQALVRKEAKPGPTAAAQPPMGGKGDLDRSIATVRSALRDGFLKQAGIELQEAEAVATTASDKSRVAGVRELHDQLVEFWQAVVSGATRCVSGEEMTIGRGLVAVVESENGRLVLRALGKNRRFRLDRPDMIPSSLAITLAEKSLPSSTSAAIVAAYKSLHPEDDNQQLWERAAGPLPGPPAENMLATTTGNVGPPPLGSGTPPLGTTTTGNPDPDVEFFGVSGKPKKKQPAPSALEVAKVRREIRELLRDEFSSARVPKAKWDLAQQLFELARETVQDEPESAFVLYLDAAELASSVGDAKGALQILDQLDANFEYDGLHQRRADALGVAIKVMSPPLSPQTVQLIGTESVRLIDVALLDDDFDSANSLISTAMVVARRTRDRMAQAELSKKQSEIESQQRLLQKIVDARKLLEADPENASANGILAIHYCATKENWTKGLPYLAKVSDQGIAEVARLDLAEPDDVDTQYDLAERWWDLADEAKGSFGAAMKRRAVFWYEIALSDLSALRRVKAQKRINEVRN